MSVFVHAQSIKKVKKWQNFVHVVVELPLTKSAISMQLFGLFFFNFSWAKKLIEIWAFWNLA